MRMPALCVECLFDKQKHLTDDPDYLHEVRRILDVRGENDTAPYLLYLFGWAYEKRFGKTSPYGEVKRRYNDLVLAQENALRRRIEAEREPIVAALALARVGNYIDFGALNQVDENTFTELLAVQTLSAQDQVVAESFLQQISRAKRFLLITDNCGEIVLDKLLLEQLQKINPELMITVLVRGGEVLNDATEEDARYVGLDRVARIVTNGAPIAGTIYERLPDEAREAIDRADVILAKGQANYESLSRQGRHIFYSFLCKCTLFTERFGVPPLTGVFVEEV